MAALVIYSHQISARIRPGSYHESTVFIAKPLYDESSEKMYVFLNTTRKRILANLWNGTRDLGYRAIRYPSLCSFIHQFYPGP